MTAEIVINALKDSVLLSPHIAIPLMLLIAVLGFIVWGLSSGTTPLFLIPIVTFVLVVVLFKLSSPLASSVEEWKKNYAEPYIASLETKKANVVDIIENRISEWDGKKKIVAAVYVNGDLVNMTIENIKEDKNIKTNRSYVTYKFLDKDISDGYLPKYDVGYKNVIMYVPTNENIK